VEILFLCFLAWCAFAGLGYYIAGQKGRSEAEGLILGFLFGPVGVLVEALLPPISSKPRSSRGRDRVAWMPDYNDEWDSPPKPNDDPVDDQVLEFLTGIGGKPSEQIDLDAIARAANKSPDAER